MLCGLSDELTEIVSRYAPEVDLYERGLPTELAERFVESVNKARWAVIPDLKIVEHCEIPSLVKEGIPDAEQWFQQDGTVRVAGDRRRHKIGKLLARRGAMSCLRAWEQRTVGRKYIIRFTAEPEEMLMMSYRRRWTSCMRPGGAYEMGPLWSVIAGDVLALIYVEGEDEPCGRVLVRRNQDGSFTPEPKRYGDGPQDAALQIASHLKAIGRLGEYDPAANGGYSDTWSRAIGEDQA
jgi:hypothetical protein